MNVIRRFVLIAALGFALSPLCLRAAEVPAALGGVHRIVFLGDSITQGGDYVTDFECWLLAQGWPMEVLNLGLASKTASDLTPDEHAAHLEKSGLGRPFVSEPMDRVLASTKLRREGHGLMAREILTQCFGAKLVGVAGALGVNPDLPLVQANEQAAPITRQIKAELCAAKP